MVEILHVFARGQDLQKIRLAKHCTQAGFNIIELMVAVAILGILAALAAPNFSEAIQRYRVNAIRDDLVASVQLARAEAIRRRRPVVLIREEQAGCSAGVTLIDTNDWSCGWRMVEDTNSNGTISTAERGRVLQTTTIPKGYSLMHPGLGELMTSNIWGQVTGAGQRFVIAPPQGVGGKSTTTVCINTGGRIRTLKDSVACPAN